LDFLTTPNASIVTKKAPVFRRPIGTGPYRVVEWTTGSRITLERDPGYHGETARIQTVHFYIPRHPDDIGGMARKILLHDLGWYDVKLDKEQSEQYVELDLASLQMSGVFFNLSKPPFSDSAVRKAFVKSFDKRQFMAQCYPGHQIASGYLPFGLLGHNTEVKDDYHDSSEDSRAVMRNSRPITILATFDSEEESRRVNKCFADSFHAPGLSVRFSNISESQLAKAFLAGDYQAIKMSNEADFPDAYMMLSYFLSSNPYSFSRHKDHFYDAELDRALMIDDRDKRALAYAKLDKYLVENFYLLPLYYNSYKRRFHKSVKGVHASLLGEHLFSISKFYFDE